MGAFSGLRPIITKSVNFLQVSGFPLAAIMGDYIETNGRNIDP